MVILWFYGAFHEEEANSMVVSMKRGGPCIEP